MANNPSQTHNSAQAIAKMSSYGTLGGSPEWRSLLPTDITGVNAQTENASHDTIDPSNQFEAESQVGLTAAPQLRAGFTAELADVLIPGALRTQWTGPTALNATATRPTSATSAHFVVPTMGAALPVNTLIYVSGCATAANNGLKVVSGSPSTTTIPVSGGLTAETLTAAQNVTIEVCGFQFASGDATIDETSGVYTFGCTAKDATELGLVKGQPIFIGDSSAAAYAFATAADYGPAIVTSTPVAAGFTFASTFSTFVDDAGTSKTIRLFFGQTCRTVARTSGDYAESYYQIETSVENLANANATQYLYAENAAINTLTMAFPAAALATIAADLIATDVTSTGTQRTNASTPTAAKRTLPYNTTSDISGRIFLSSGGTALTGYITSVNLIVENNAQSNPAHGTLGSAITTFGKTRVRAEINAFLTESGGIDAARNNSAVTANWWIRNGECAYCFYIPEARLRNGNANFPKGQVVTIDLPLMANKDATYAASLIVGKIPGCPALPARS